MKKRHLAAAMRIARRIAAAIRLEEYNLADFLFDRLDARVGRKRAYDMVYSHFWKV